MNANTLTTWKEDRRRKCCAHECCLETANTGRLVCELGVVEACGSYYCSNLGCGMNVLDGFCAHAKYTHAHGRFVGCFSCCMPSDNIPFCVHCLARYAMCRCATAWATSHLSLHRYCMGLLLSQRIFPGYLQLAIRQSAAGAQAH